MPWPPGYSMTLTPAQREERARHAALARTTTEHHIKMLGKQTLTDEQRAQLAAILLRDIAAAS